MCLAKEKSELKQKVFEFVNMKRKLMQKIVSKIFVKQNQKLLLLYILEREVKRMLFTRSIITDSKFKVMVQELSLVPKKCFEKVI